MRGWIETIRVTHCALFMLKPAQLFATVLPLLFAWPRAPLGLAAEPSAVDVEFFEKVMAHAVKHVGVAAFGRGARSRTLRICLRPVGTVRV